MISGLGTETISTDSQTLNEWVFRLARTKPDEQKTVCQTAGQWPWKSESAKECVTTHLPKKLALKMDGAEASCLYSAVSRQSEAIRSRTDPSSSPDEYGGRGGVRRRALVARRPGAAASADLGGSSKYSKEALEG
ncbi:UNVERIFIED_CONTAM: hypothetical protein PYX00_010833 [Menopon gallinae]|uniref:Uncharacterized protein n=1 Tax=Menopon gallinae TaxID=328185 RepID=A0AAW2H6R0_9NEOP